MGSMSRSEEMVLCQLFVQPEAAYSTVSELGEMGIVQFRDLNVDVNMFQRKFANEVQRCSEMERQLRYIESEVTKNEMKIPTLNELPRALNPREIINLEAHLEKVETEIKELSENEVNLKSNFKELTELKHVLEKSQQFFTEHGDGRNRSISVVSRIFSDDGHGSRAGSLSFVAGIADRKRVPAFEQMLWRISRGNVFIRQAPLDKKLEDPVTGEKKDKIVFVAFFQGEQLKSKVMKVCTGFRASVYHIPNLKGQRKTMLADVNIRLEDLKMVFNQTHDLRDRVLSNVSRKLQNWNVMVRKMKAIYHTLNMFNMDVTQKCMIAECWVPYFDVPQVQRALIKGSDDSGSAIHSFLNVIKTPETPPTFNRTNRFTEGFQNLVDSYGVACYREANPALYTIITFPFLFAVMFGDAGHGVIIAAFGLFMVLKENHYLAKKSSSEIWNIFFGGRYTILLMGIFSIYTGLIYNDVFSKSFNMFGSAWKNPYLNYEEFNNTSKDIDPIGSYRGTPYPFGVDPIWQLGINKINFLNSYKMKLSIILAVVHMLFGICMSVVNHVHFKRYINILVEFLPNVIFFTVLICYLTFLMFYKWFMYAALNAKDDPNREVPNGPTCAPSVLIMFINMMLRKKPEKTFPFCEKYMYSGQATVELTFLILALLCVPVMLCAKPIVIILKRKWSHPSSEIPTTAAKKEVAGGHDHDNEPISEVWINQGIHTIEFCLNTISHTASYLRLWALSLAHAQLSDVLWGMVFRRGLKMSSSYVGGVTIFVFFAVWAVFTLAILVLMEGLSAFLHTLRLHWVEFMSKFYSGTGYLFEPFSFQILAEVEEADKNE